jgi:predicted nucleic acid-binding protein
MRFWDTSALVALLIPGDATPFAQRTLASDELVSAWWATPVECASAIARLERQGDVTPAEAAAAFSELQTMKHSWHRVPATEDLQNIAIRLLRVHPLRAADALQLAAAVVASDRRPATLEFVCLDSRLNEAASREGFLLVRWER